MEKYLTIERRPDGEIARLSGEWTLANLGTLSQVSAPSLTGQAALDGSQLSSLDTAGAALLLTLFGKAATQLQLLNFKPAHKSVLDLVMERQIDVLPPDGSAELPPLQRAGKAAEDIARGGLAILNFLGQTISAFFQTLLRPKLMRHREFCVQLEHVLVDAIPICALVTFLIGLVISYLYASQMQRYGANIFIVDAVAIAMCRELSPLIIAIIMAGRSGSAFTAQLGTMKLNDEIDALTTLGLSPMNVLVLPRVLALMLALPFLVFIGDLAGGFAGLLIGDLYLNITPATFIERLHTVMKFKTLMVGVLKAPIFAAFIAVIGCQMGLNVENNARSVGLNTTSTVVQSIVSVILLNAIFAVILVELKI